MSDFETRVFEKLDKLVDTQSKIQVELGKQSEKHDATYKIVEKLETKVGKQNGKIGKLEGWRNRIAGAVALLIVLVGYWIKWGD